jgi:hypothetical protein
LTDDVAPLVIYEVTEQERDVRSWIFRCVDPCAVSTEVGDFDFSVCIPQKLNYKPDILKFSLQAWGFLIEGAIERDPFISLAQALVPGLDAESINEDVFFWFEVVSSFFLDKLDDWLQIESRVVEAGFAAGADYDEEERKGREGKISFGLDWVMRSNQEQNAFHVHLHVDVGFFLLLRDAFENLPASQPRENIAIKIPIDLYVGLAGLDEETFKRAKIGDFLRLAVHRVDRNQVLLEGAGYSRFWAKDGGDGSYTVSEKTRVGSDELFFMGTNQ